VWVLFFLIIGSKKGSFRWIFHYKTSDLWRPTCKIGRNCARTSLGFQPKKRLHSRQCIFSLLHMNTPNFS
jgi:hypothetical protein